MPRIYRVMNQRDNSDGGPTIFAVVKHDKGVDDIVNLVISAWKGCGAYGLSLEKWKREGRKASGDT